MIETPQIVETAAQPAAVIHLTVPRNEIQNAMGPGYQEVMAAIAAQGMAPAGPWFTRHLRMDPEVFDFLIGVPVAAPIDSVGRVVQGELPAARVARTVYAGPYEGLGDAWAALDAWISAEGYTTGPGLWERYTSGPEASPDPTDWRTELIRPIQESR
jgi:effector-binding domain-containing protein